MLLPMRSNRRRGFTLIELVVVMIVLGLLASIVIFSLRGNVQRRQLTRAVETFQMFDARARRDAMRLGNATVTIDKNRGKLTVAARRNEATYKLPSQVTIAEVRSPRGVQRGSKVEFAVGKQGNTPTYAVRFERGDVSQWLVIVGRSGQVVPVANQGEVDAILEL